MHEAIELKKKFVEVAIDSGQAVWVVDINSLTIAEGMHAYPCNVSIGGRVHGHVFSLLGADIKSHMPMPLTKLTEICHNPRLVGDWPTEIIPRINERLGVQRGRKKKNNNNFQYMQHNQIYHGLV